MGWVGLGSVGLGWVGAGRVSCHACFGPVTVGIFRDMSFRRVWSRHVGWRTRSVWGVLWDGRVRSWVFWVVVALWGGCVGLGSCLDGLVRSGPFSPSLALRFYFPLLSALRGVAMLSEQHSLKNCCCFCLSVGAGKCFFSFVTFPCKTRFRVFILWLSQSWSFRTSLSIECAGENV